jgi:hypothetical protein
MPCSNPVVFLIFRRPDLTARVFEAIRQAQPTKLFVVADGPRNEAEAELCQKARAVTEQVDWDCEVLRNYSDVNLGCRMRVSSGLNWAFEKVEEAIVLEDDCLPHPSFFTYCQELLTLYRHDERIWCISGDNFQDGQQRTPYSYYFSKYNHCWGWATWRRAWQHWEFNPQKWVEFRDEGLIQSVCEDPYEAKYWTHIFDSLFLEGRPNSWAYAWTFACWSQGGLTALPNVNLVSNIGFIDSATHTCGDSQFADMAVEDIQLISHPPFVIQHKEADSYTFNSHFGGYAQRQADSIRYKLKHNIVLFKNRLKRVLKDPNGSLLAIKHHIRSSVL